MLVLALCAVLLLACSIATTQASRRLSGELTAARCAADDLRNVRSALDELAGTAAQVQHRRGAVLASVRPAPLR